MTIKKGTLIRIGSRPGIKVAARQLVIKIQRDIDWGDEVRADIVENPNGWPHDEIHHTVNKKWDKVVFLNNAHAAEGLVKP